MGLEVYYPADIRNALLAAEQAVSETAHATSSLDDPVAASFLAGYRAALTTFALAFGLVAKLEPQIARDVIRDWPNRQSVPLMALVERSD